MTIFKAAVVGLGNIGYQFNLDPKRTETWSHVASYEKCTRTELVAAVEISRENIAVFKKRYQKIPVYNTIDELMSNKEVDIISICTPTSNHYSAVETAVKYNIKAVFCEKPLAPDTFEGKKIVRICEDKNIVLAVNHNRRWDSRYLSAKKIISDFKIGTICAVTAMYTKHIYNIGTHLIDTIRMLISKEPVNVGGISFDIEDTDPDISGWIEFEDNIPCTITSTGRKKDVIFDIDIIGKEGRMILFNDAEDTRLYSFIGSPNYSDYRELKVQHIDCVDVNDRFVDAVNDICKVIDGDKAYVNSSGKDGLVALNVIEAFVQSAKMNGKQVKLGC